VARTTRLNTFASRFALPCRSNVRLLALFIAVAQLGAIRVAVAQTDEIQVYDASHADPGVFNLTWHNNFTPSGVTVPAFPGAVVADKSFNGVTEWAYGVTSWFEQGLYLPLYTIDKNLGATFDGFKLRELFTVPHADARTFVYGVNVEFSFNARHWDSTRFTSEVRPIIGWHLQSWDIIVNPILDTAYDGVKNVHFAPETRLAYRVSNTWAVAAEEYADFGPLHQFNSLGDQVHQIYGVVDRNTKNLAIEFGLGFGLTNASDSVTLKLLVSFDLNRKREAAPDARRDLSARR
jgi:hypothetical protein